MAKLSAHGAEIGRLCYLTKDLAVMADGKALVNYGHGWKLHATVKAGLTPTEAYERRKASQAEFLRDNPAFDHYRALLHDAAPLGDGRRSMLHTAISMMPEDADGVWSEVTDTIGGPRLSLSQEECLALCLAYQSMMAEAKERKARQAATAPQPVGAA